MWFRTCIHIQETGWQLGMWSCILPGQPMNLVQELNVGTVTLGATTYFCLPYMGNESIVSSCQWTMIYLSCYPFLRDLISEKNDIIWLGTTTTGVIKYFLLWVKMMFTLNESCTLTIWNGKNGKPDIFIGLQRKKGEKSSFYLLDIRRMGECCDTDTNYLSYVCLSS